MDFDLNVLLIVLPFIFLAGFVDSIAGGGGLISISGFFLAGVSPLYALGTNKAQSTVGTMVATYNYIKNDHYNRKVILYSVIGSLIGATIGAEIANRISEDILKIIVVSVLPFVGLIMLSKKKPTFQLHDMTPIKINSITFLIGLILGLYDGAIGPGTGTFLIIAFTMCGLSMLEANGNSKIVNLASNLAAVVVYIYHGRILLWIAIPAMIVNIIANHIGSSLAIKNGEKVIRPMIIFILILVFIKTFYDIIN